MTWGVQPCMFFFLWLTDAKIHLAVERWIRDCVVLFDRSLPITVYRNLVVRSLHDSLIISDLIVSYAVVINKWVTYWLLIRWITFVRRQHDNTTTQHDNITHKERTGGTVLRRWDKNSVMNEYCYVHLLLKKPIDYCSLLQSNEGVYLFSYTNTVLDRFKEWLQSIGQIGLHIYNTLVACE